MPKATFKLPDGTTIQVEGTADEVKQLLEHYAERSSASEKKTPVTAQSPARTRRRPKPQRSPTPPATEPNQPDLAAIVAAIKNADDAEAIERNILDRTSQVDRILLPLYIHQEILGVGTGLTSGEISSITKQLGVPVSTANASGTLSRTASRYVIGDKVRRRGQAVRYTLSRKGLQYIRTVIGGQADAKS